MTPGQPVDSDRSIRRDIRSALRDSSVGRAPVQPNQDTQIGSDTADMHWGNHRGRVEESGAEIEGEASGRPDLCRVLESFSGSRCDRLEVLASEIDVDLLVHKHNPTGMPHCQSHTSA